MIPLFVKNDFKVFQNFLFVMTSLDMILMIYTIMFFFLVFTGLLRSCQTVPNLSLLDALDTYF